MHDYSSFRLSFEQYGTAIRLQLRNIQNAVPELTGIRQVFCRRLAVTCKPDDRYWLQLVGKPTCRAMGELGYHLQRTGLKWLDDASLKNSQAVFALFAARRKWKARIMLTKYVAVTHGIDDPLPFAFPASADASAG